MILIGSTPGLSGIGSNGQELEPDLQMQFNVKFLIYVQNIFIQWLINFNRMPTHLGLLCA